MDSLNTAMDNPPGKFYRVQSPESTVTWDESGLHAIAEADLRTEEEVLDAVKEKLRRNSIRNSPFIPVFSDRQKALDWALALKHLCNGIVSVIEIDTNMLGEGIAVSAERARKLLGSGSITDRWYDSEWLILGHVPSSAIVSWKEIEDPRPDSSNINWPEGVTHNQ
ncbi:hypothetical protein BDV59DRAFT_176050 [Aspergillus ambiguus]|uniref:uncharacterized protein n=1 Tax=Aspergillus ambiguus TaxID=176160 RepID=UPI003CCDAC3B